MAQYLNISQLISYIDLTNREFFSQNEFFFQFLQNNDAAMKKIENRTYYLSASLMFDQ